MCPQGHSGLTSWSICIWTSPILVICILTRGPTVHKEPQRHQWHPKVGKSAFQLQSLPRMELHQYHGPEYKPNAAESTWGLWSWKLSDPSHQENHFLEVKILSKKKTMDDHLIEVTVCKCIRPARKYYWEAQSPEWSRNSSLYLGDCYPET
jgi:hypothetical protein